ncbi:hypothetical protein [Aliarcobacter butzleri]|uniref:hypothetical protein n=1 Tax=Aliarcobacter butzleri TaxID=28197 RepID=UPI0021B1B899|nr:hypothetical protein [Aliarcobacter butzleri]MCT7625792.1 hypothetical protein [Aliarcobacter butzleri]
MKNFQNWGHIYGIVFNERGTEKIEFVSFIKEMIKSQKTKKTYYLDNEEKEVIFISTYKEYDDGYAFLIGRTNEEISKTKFDTKTFNTEEIEFNLNEHMSDYTHIYISKNNVSTRSNYFYVLLEKNQRIQIGIIKKLIGNIIGYKSLDDKEKSLVYIGAIMQSDYIKKLINNEIVGKSIIVNETKKNILDLPDDDENKTITKVTQISKYATGIKFLKGLTYLIENPESCKNRDILLIVDDGKNNNKQIPFEETYTKYVPFFQLPFYLKSRNTTINEKVVEKFQFVTKNNDYETL